MGTDKTALVTGATSGIGRATARHFAAAGWNVVAVGRRSDRLETLAVENAAILPIAHDVRDVDGLLGHLDGLPPSHRAVDLLVNNAGVAQRTRMQETPWSELQVVLETNVHALAELTHRLLPGLMDRRGAIINISSPAATYPTGNSVVYSGAKAFVTQFSRALRADLHGTGVRVTVLEPGYTATEMMLGEDAMEPTAADEQSVRLAPADIAEILFFIATLPERVDVTHLEVLPTGQSLSGWRLHGRD